MGLHNVEMLQTPHDRIKPWNDSSTEYGEADTRLPSSWPLVGTPGSMPSWRKANKLGRIKDYEKINTCPSVVMAHKSQLD